MRLVERGEVLGRLDEFLVEAISGHGRLVFVAGEAGIGKTSVVGALLDRHRRDVRGLVGGCDALSTPRPLGPLHDMAASSDEVAALLGRQDRHELFVEMLSLLSTPGRPTVVVLEDVHWADGATLDLLRFLGRRVARSHALVLATYRSDEVGHEHPLRAVLGDLATVPAVARLALSPLTPAGVAELTGGTSLDPALVHARTAGNPFFVSEVLAHPAEHLPVSVRDAVLARRARLEHGARAVVDAVAVVPGSIEGWLLECALGSAAEQLDACVLAGILCVGRDGMVRFRHELARLAVEDALPPAGRAALHRRVLQALIDEGIATIDPGRVAHHADAAGDPRTVLEHATAAAELAASRGAHREAADHLSRALRHASRLTPERRAGLLERFVEARSDVGAGGQEVAAAEEAVTLRRQGDDLVRLGAALRLLAITYWTAGRGPEAHATILDALAVLEAEEEGTELVEALGTRVTLDMLARRYEAALAVGAPAIALAERLAHPVALSRLLNSVGSVEILMGRADQGQAHLLRSIEVARAAGIDRAVAGGLSNLGSAAGEVRDYPAAERHLREAIAYAAARDIDVSEHYATSWLARVAFETGRWDMAAELVTSLPLDHPSTSPIVVITALTVLGRLRARRGDPGADEGLDRAWHLAVETADLQRLWPVAAARGEAALLRGDLDAVPELVRDTYDLACRLEHPWAAEELAALLWQAGQPQPRDTSVVVGGAGEPYRLQRAGRPAAAAAVWASVGCPYEQAVALADGNEGQQRVALQGFDRLGAAPAAAALRRRMRDGGIRSVPRGPRPRTADHPAGLTAREAEVLDLVARGLTNAEIGTALFISAKTAGHHVSSILAKLGVASRQAAARYASPT